MTDNDPAQSGEARLKARYKAFIRHLALAALIGIAAGALSGVTLARVEDGALPKSVFIGLWSFMVALFVWFTRDYFRRIDEVDLIDNLWASTIGLYGYIAAFCSWFMFHRIGLTPPPGQLTILLTTVIIATIAYFVRKVRQR
ncbi:MAG: hypothetical protein KJZ64_12120 [Sphingomonadaceae bacterium]|nr:hypothetical protein [Sphingomonadaceae bacterium]